MGIREGIESRRAYRSLNPAEIDEGLVRDLARHAGLAPSCFNHQPWRFVFVYEKQSMQEVFSALSKSNLWASNASMIVAVFSQKKFDCVIKGREYHLFDSGMATAFMILRATELGLVAHPIAGFDEGRVKNILGIPEEMTLITLVIVGRKSEAIRPQLTEKQVEKELERPQRLKFEEFAFLNHYKKE